MAPPPDPAAQAKGLKVVALALVGGGLLVGVVLPALFVMLKIEVLMTSSGFDAMWLVFIAMMLIDFGLARWFWRRATTLDRAAQGLPPQGSSPT